MLFCRAVLFVCFVVSLLFTLLPGSQAQESGAEAPIWKSDTSLQSHLAPEKAFGTFGLRLPGGYSLAKQIVKGNTSQVKEYIYFGPPRPSDILPIFVVMVAPAGSMTSSVLMDISAGTMLQDKQGMTISPRQNGQVNGLAVVRQYWKYPEKAGVTIHGFFYSSSTDSGAVSIMSKDAEPYSKASLALMEASALTIHPLDAMDSVPPAADASDADGPPEAQSQGYALRLPPGFLPVAFPAPPGLLTGVFWGGQATPGTNPPVLMLSTKQLKPSEVNSDVSFQFALGVIVGMTRDLRGPITSTPQNVQIGGWQAVRLSWQGTKTVAGKSAMLHGFSYSLLDGTKLVMILGMDSGPEAQVQLPLMEAAARSLHKP